MTTFRTALSAALLLVCGLGYASSQFAYWRGNPAKWIADLDASAVPALAWVLLAGLVAAVALDRGPEAG